MKLTRRGSALCPPSRALPHHHHHRHNLTHLNVLCPAVLVILLCGWPALSPVVVHGSFLDSFVDSVKYNILWHSGCKYSETFYNRSFTTQEIKEKLQAKANEATCSISGVIGQELAFRMLPTSIQAHISNQHTQKPLVIVMAGSPGTGKSTYERALRELFFKDQSCVAVVNSVDYMDPQQTASSSFYVRKKIAAAVKKCPRTVVIVDEIHHLPGAVLDSLLDILGSYAPVSIRMDKDKQPETVDFAQAIFILTTNDGGKEIDELAYSLEKNTASEDRGNLDHVTFSNVVQGFFQQSYKKLAAKKAVDHFIPFIPMTEHDGRRYTRLRLESLNCMGQRLKWFASLNWTSNVEWTLPSRVCKGGKPQNHGPCRERYLRDGLGGLRNLFDEKVYALVNDVIEQRPRPKNPRLLPTVHLSVHLSEIVAQVVEPKEGTELDTARRKKSKDL